MDNVKGTKSGKMLNCKLEVRSKLWLESEKELFFSRGRRQLLRAIDKFGCLRRAADDTGMTYTQVWMSIRTMEELADMKFIKKVTDSEAVIITDAAREFIVKYERLEKDIAEFADRRFAKLFD